MDYIGVAAVTIILGAFLNNIVLSYRRGEKANTLIQSVGLVAAAVIGLQYFYAGRFAGINFDLVINILALLLVLLMGTNYLLKRSSRRTPRS